ncbi:UDP-N-acetylmuramate dehydrogenase [Neptunicella sp. SCSIO 80796]|uniref:UDP-N-acetylmuramate dehydrogenase n=1 Tax=Neptunicella plasticusilytica TaxID=3117012 RepID=UPI003A4D3504
MTSLKSFHTFGFSAHAKKITHLNSVADIKSALPLHRPFYILGGGSNSIFVDDFAGEIVKINLRGIECNETQEDFGIKVKAGENWHEFVEYCVKRGMYGLENLALIPGTVGAAPIQNIGAYGREVSGFIQSVDYIELATGEAKSILQADCGFGYRDSIFKHELSDKVIITAVNFVLPKKWVVEQSYGELANLSNPTAQDIFDKVVKIRQAKLPDPSQLGNAGSFFKNPVIGKPLLKSIREKWPAIPSYPVSDEQCKVPAAWLIDQLGYKGKTLGGILCHHNQPLVLANTGIGTGRELLQFARKIRDDVLVTFSIKLENEVRLLTTNGLIDL